MHHFKIFLLLATTGLMLVAPITHADQLAVDSDIAGAELLRQAKALSQDGPDYRYQLTTSVDGIASRLVIDPTQDAGQRVTVLEPSAEKHTEEFNQLVAEIDADADKDFWCADLLEDTPETVQVVANDDQTITYEFTPIPDADADKTERKMMKVMKGRLVIDRQNARVQSFSLNLPKPVRAKLVARIEKFDMQIDCAASPDGRTFIKDFSIEVAGRAMMKNFSESDGWTISDLQQVNAVE